MVSDSGELNFRSNDVSGLSAEIIKNPYKNQNREAHDRRHSDEAKTIWNDASFSPHRVHTTTYKPFLLCRKQVPLQLQQFQSILR